MKNTQISDGNSTRLAYIDGFRGLAVLLVVGFHVFTRNDDILNFGVPLRGFFLFKTG